MSEQQDPEGGLSTAGFDAWYRGELDEDAVRGLDRIPWDIGAPQPVLVELERAGRIRSEVLDIGCGPGDNAVFLAERGYRVLAVDGAPSAIEQARERVRPGLDVRFVVDDATELNGYDGRFSTVLDSALYHCLSAAQQDEYLAAIHRCTVPGAVLHLVCFSDAAPEEFPGPERFSEAYLRDSLASHWNITSLEQARYVTSFTRESLERVLGHVPESLETDERGRVLMPVWAVAAERK